MVDNKFVIPAIAAAALVVGGVAAKRLVAQWAKNPDPLDGEPLRFPAGQVRSVEMPDGALINTVLTGSGPTVVCVHGLTSNHLDWAPIVESLINARYSVLAIDQRGHGESTAGSAGFGSGQLADDLAVVFETLDIHAVALMGHSMGGMAAMSFAVTHPTMFTKRVQSLILVATAASLRTVRHSVAMRVGGLGIPEVVRPKDERLRVSVGLGAFGARPSLHMIDQSIAQFRTCPDDVRAAATAALRHHHVIDQLDTVEVPALVIGGTRDQLIRPNQVEDLAARIAGSRLQMYTGAGHMVIWERHAEMATLIARWLDDPVAAARLPVDDQTRAT